MQVLFSKEFGIDRKFLERAGVFDAGIRKEGNQAESVSGRKSAGQAAGHIGQRLCQSFSEIHAIAPLSVKPWFCCVL